MTLSDRIAERTGEVWYDAADVAVAILVLRSPAGSTYAQGSHEVLDLRTGEVGTALELIDPSGLYYGTVLQRLA